ncbi:helix-turn-helix domain-containing protein [Mycobacteroides franklinii]|uniref:helix-turn-helix domain-containing protein n=1 Tax=Mycobacteroides franklinii TaxID=948102 RepID=UPI0013E8CF00
MRVKDGDRVRRWRKQRHYSQRELAFLVRRTQSTIYLIETNKLRAITEDLALAIAARLDVPWEDLFESHEACGLLEMANDACPDTQDLTVQNAALG